MKRQKELDYVEKYRYLGLTLSENIDYKVSVNELSAAASRSLGSLTSKFLHMGNMDFEIYTKIYDNTVIPVMDYASGIWGIKRYDSLERLQYRVIRTFLGISKCAPIPAVLGDMGWLPVYIHTQCNAIRLWCRLMKMPDNRLCRKVFCWDIETSTRYKNTWFNNIKTVLNTCNLTHLINYSGENISTNYVLETVKSKCVDDFKDRWSNEVRTMPKLRTYKTFKSEFSTEPYVKRHLSRVQRSALARIRSGTFPLEIEQGRYRNIPPNLRICKLCNSGSIEDETHFLIYCDRYTDARNRLLRELPSIHIDELPPNEAITVLLNANTKLVANFILECSNIRREFI
ncbi:unnamed protein product [Mytilus edulis]|uniref:Uncharacterized protein n=1 Tax=Mytilus edulis TaxID=6550 RepID=A0A8S3SYJ6_MYTED|nr:unnamed protein product [Mytilus edulis]